MDVRSGPRGRRHRSTPGPPLRVPRPASSARSTAPRWRSCGSSTAWSGCWWWCARWRTAGSSRSTPDRPTTSPTPASAGSRRPGVGGTYALLAAIGTAAILVALGWRLPRCARGVPRRVRVARARRGDDVPEPLLVRHAPRARAPRPPGRRVVVARRARAAGSTTGAARRDLARARAGGRRVRVRGPRQAERRLAPARRCRCASGSRARSDLAIIGPWLDEPWVAHRDELGRRRVRLPGRPGVVLAEDPAVRVVRDRRVPRA